MIATRCSQEDQISLVHGLFPVSYFLLFLFTGVLGQKGICWFEELQLLFNDVLFHSIACFSDGKRPWS